MTSLVFSAEIPAALPEVWAWHARPRAFDRLVPPWSAPRVLSEPAALANGERVELEIRRGLLRWHWLSDLSCVEPGRRFVDTQIRGPFAQWRHEHLFEPRGTSGSRLLDRLDYTLPGGPLGRLLESRIRAELEQIFAWRERTLIADLALHRRLALDPQRVAVSGASGFLGCAVCDLLATGGHQVQRLVRHFPTTDDEVEWSPERGLADPTTLDGVDAVIHLAGENLASGRWTAARKQRIRSSRVEATERLVADLARLARPPRVVIVASAVGFYGDQPFGRELDETAPLGGGFLAEVCRDWEAAAARADTFARRVSLRLAPVLDPRGGALAAMAPAFRAGLGGPIGGGRHPFAWVSRDDAAAAILWALGREKLNGSINVVAPDTRTQRGFARALAAALSRPAFAPLPAALVSLLFGEMGREMLLAGQHAVPAVLLADGFAFRDPRLEPALAALFGRPRKEPLAA